MEEDPSKTTLIEEPLNHNGCSLYRGHLKMALLRCLSSGDMHGLEMIKRIKEITSGEWVPSPGSVYPILREFERDRLAVKRQDGRTLIYSLTDEGRRSLRSLHEDVKHQLYFMEWLMKEDLIK